MTEGVYQKLGPKTFWIFVIKRSAVFFIVVFLVILLFVLKYFTDSAGLSQYSNLLNSATLVGFICSALSFILGFFIAYLEYIRFQIMLGEDTFNITRGVLTREENSLPYRRIKSVDIRQPIIFQIIGVSRMIIETVIDTGGGSDSKNDDNDEVIPSIDDKLALELQSELTKRSNIQKFKSEIQK